MKAVREIVTILRTALLEIFEENAYARFLVHHRLENSRKAYALYLRETNSTRERRPRCC